MNIILQPFQPHHQAEAKNLVLAGLAEHWGTLDPSKNPDLNDIATHYAEGLFLLALQESQLIGTGALVRRANNAAEIVRMSVATNLRRHGIGKLILSHLCEYAKTQGYQRIILETTETWHEVIAFYQTYGFQITHYQDGDVYFALDL